MTAARDPSSSDRTAEPLALARSLAVVGSGAVLILAALAWGRGGLIAAGLGASLSIVNAWAMARFADRAAARAAAQEPHAATAQLTAALGAKSAVLLTAVWVLTRSGKIAIAPLALGLMVSVLSLLGAGLWTALRAARAQ